MFNCSSRKYQWFSGTEEPSQLPNTVIWLNILKSFLTRVSSMPGLCQQWIMDITNGVSGAQEMKRWQKTRITVTVCSILAICHWNIIPIPFLSLGTTITPRPVWVATDLLHQNRWFFKRTAQLSHQSWSEYLQRGNWIMQLCMAQHLVVSNFRYHQNSASDGSKT